MQLQSRTLKIAVIPAQFDPALKYQENVLCDSLHRAGHQVHVFSPGPELKASDEVPFPVSRGGRYFSFGSTKLPLDRTVHRELKTMNPDVAFILAPLHGTGWAWMKALPRRCRVVAGFSDIPLHREGSRVKAFIKRCWARSVFRRAALVISATRQTTQLLKDWGADLLDGKLKETGLWVDTSKLHGEELPAEVAKLAANVEYFGALVTRITADKRIGEFFHYIDQFLGENPSAGFVIAGLDDGVPSMELRAAIAASPHASRCVVLPMLSSGRIGALFRAARFSLWNSVSIGMYHSLASGCRVVVWSCRGSAEHLVEEGRNGFWYKNWEDAPAAMKMAAMAPDARETAVASIEDYVADTGIPRLLDEVLHMRLPN